MDVIRRGAAHPVEGGAAPTLHLVTPTSGDRPAPAGKEPRPDRIEGLFELQVARTPAETAVHHGTDEISYAALDRRANKIAHRLIELGVGPENVVGLCMDRSIDMIAAMIAIFKAGGAYVPLDPTYPAPRLSYMLEDSGARVMVTRGRVPDGLVYDGRTVDLVDDNDLIEALPETVPERTGDHGSLAYVFYTSGSTGRPKGVMLEHTAIHLIRWAISAYEPEVLKRVTASTSICFDPSVFEIFTPLSVGGTVILKNSPLEPFAPHDRPTMVGSVPTVLADIVARNAMPTTTLVVMTGGERLTGELARAILKQPNVRYVSNHYGPTEATTSVTECRVTRDRLDLEPSIGFPMAGAVIRILDEDGRDLAPGVDGEIHISGPFLARGYKNSPAGANGFFPDPADPTRRLYRTGDVGHFLPSGEIIYVGRAGDFFKINGQRIAPGEVEHALLRIDGIRQAAVTLDIDANGRDRLIAHVVPDGRHVPTLEGIRKELRDWLPNGMLPTWLHVHNALPTTLNNKIDRKALPGVPTDNPLPRVDPSEYLPLMRAAADIMADALGLFDVRPDDDFFGLGGDSLLAVEIALQLETMLGQPVSPALLVHAPTPRLLHHALENERRDESRHITTMQDQGAQIPIYCLPDVYGRALSFITLARRMAPDQPVHALQVGPITEAFVRRPSMDMLASAYVRAIRDHRPEGPYRIAGYSFGGSFAQEVARRLHADGDDVSLVIIDCPNRRARLRMGAFVPWLARRGRDGIRRHGVAKTVRNLYPRSRNLATYLFKRKRIRLPGWISEIDRDLAAAHIRAEVDHEPRPFHGRTLMIAAREQNPVNAFADIDGRLGWSGILKGPVDIRFADVVHEDIVRNAYVDELVGHMRNFFAQE